MRYHCIYFHGNVREAVTPFIDRNSYILGIADGVVSTPSTNAKYHLDLDDANLLAWVRSIIHCV